VLKKKYICAGQTGASSNEQDSTFLSSWERKSSGASKQAHGQKESYSSNDPLLDRTMDLMRHDISLSTWQSYNSAVKQYLEYMKGVGKPADDPSEMDLCKWVGYISLFLDPSSLPKYISGLTYYLDTLGGGKGDRVRKGLVSRVVRGAMKKYGLPGRDERESMSTNLLEQIAKRVDRKSHDDRCMMAACSILFVCCLRCGELTVKDSRDPVILKRKHWKYQDKKGEIFLSKSKTDPYGRGYILKYRKMQCAFDPGFWMLFYSDFHKSWTGNMDEPLFMRENGKPLDRITLIQWVREKARKTGWSGWSRLNGISFRRGSAQVLREHGYNLEQIAKQGRWGSTKTVARYKKSTEKSVGIHTRLADGDLRERKIKRSKK
jgi:hypothetical protein